MRSYRSTIIPVLMAVTMCSCESASKQHQDAINTEETNITRLAVRIDGIEADLCKFMEKVNNLEKETNRQVKIQDEILPIVGVSLSAIAFILYGIVCRRLSKKIKRLEGDLSNYKARLDSLSSRQTKEENSTSCRLGPYEEIIPKLECRIEKLERQLSQNELPKRANRKNDATQRTSVHTEYAMHTKTDIFGDITPSRQEGSFYEITSGQEGKGEFTIISLAKLQNQDGWDKVIDCDGDCKLTDATDYKVESPGRCEKVDGGWKVTNKLKIRIFTNKK